MSDFSQRFEGGIENISNWKASEMHLFLLCIVVVLFASKEIIAENVCLNFYHFSTMKLLLINGQEINLKFIKNRMTNFVKDAQSLYGTSFVSYNVLRLIHLHEYY